MSYVTFAYKSLAKTNYMVPPNHKGAMKYNPTMGLERKWSKIYLQKNTNDYHAKFSII